MAIIIDNSVKNKKDTPSITSDVAANLPAATDVPVGAIYIETDTGTIKQSDGITWQILGGGGGPGTQDLASVLSIGNTATNNIVLNGAPGNGNVTAASIVSAGSGEVKIGKSTSGYVELRDSTERKALLGDGSTDVVKFRSYNGNSFIIDYDNNAAGNITTLVSEQPLYEPASPGQNLTNFEVRPNINSKLGFGSANLIGFYYNPLITNAASINEIAFKAERGKLELITGTGTTTINSAGTNIELNESVSNGTTNFLNSTTITLNDSVNFYNNTITAAATVLQSLTDSLATQPTFVQLSAIGATDITTLQKNTLQFYDTVVQQVQTSYTGTGITLNGLITGTTFNLLFYEAYGGGYVTGDYYFQGQGTPGIVKTIDYQEKNVIDWDFGSNPTLTVDGLYTKTYFCFNVGGNIVLDNTQFRNGVIVYICIDHGSTGNVAVTTAGPIFPPALLGASPINKSGMYSVTYNANLDTFAISHV